MVEDNQEEEDDPHQIADNSQVFSISGLVAMGDRAPPIFGTMKTNAFSTNVQSRFASVVVDGVLRPRA